MQKDDHQMVVNQTGSIDYDQLETDKALTQDPVEILRNRAAQKLKQIGIPGTNDILDAFHDKDDQEHSLTVVDIQLNYLDLTQEEVTHSKSIMLTMNPEVIVEKTGSYNTVALQFPKKKSAEINRLWSLLSDYGTEMAQFDVSAGEMPIISITVIPMTLGGQYGMVASDPIFYHLQPSSPMEDYCDQIRLLFAPESVMFVRDDSFKSDEVLATVKMELASERLNEEAIIQAQLEKEEFEKEHEKEMQEYREHYQHGKHQFTASTGADGTFKTDATHKSGFRSSAQSDQDR